MKFQTPTVGGIRKVIRTGENTAVGTTIAEVGAGTISLNQLAAIITQIQNQQVNNGGGNIGDGSEGTITLGPGLAGGGPLVGNVPIRLTIPPALIAENGIDGDPGPQGIQGAQGKQGVQGLSGAATALIPEDVWFEELMPHPAASATGFNTINGNLIVNPPSGSQPGFLVNLGPTQSGAAFYLNDPSVGAGVTPHFVISATGNTNGASFTLAGNGSNPNKSIRVRNGNLAVLNNAFSATLMLITDAGLISAPTSPLASALTQVHTGLANFKSALSTSANATLTADAALTVTCNETGWYDVEVYLNFYEATAGTGGFQFDFNAGGATIANASFAVNGYSTAAFSNAATTSIATATGIGTVGTSSAAPSWVKVKGTIQVTVAGTFGIRWAQNTILAIDPTTLAAGSNIILTKIG